MRIRLSIDSEMRTVIVKIIGVILAFLPTPKHPGAAGPGLHLRWRWGWIKGLAYKLVLSIRAELLGSDFRAGKRLSIQGSLRVKGAGAVALGDDIIIDCRTDLYTHSKTATVTVGNRTFLNGTRFGVAESVNIGDDCIIADARIMDTDFHAIGKDRNSKEAEVLTAPVVIESNVWIAAAAAVLKGVTIGANSVIGFGGVVTGDVPADKIYAGNPAREVGNVPD